MDSEVNALVEELEQVVRRLDAAWEEELVGVARDIEAILYNCGTYSE